MRVLITGATGFLGRWVTRTLLEAGHAARLLVRNTNKLGSLAQLDVEVCAGDILVKESLERALPGVDAVVNCAACVSLKPRDRSLIFESNVVGTRNVLEAAAARKLRVLHTSSIAAIGPTRLPEVLDEASSPCALDFEYPYADSKRLSEDLALAYARAGADVVVLNPGIMLGPDDAYFSSTEFVMHYLKGELGVHLPGGGSFCDVRDVAAVYPAALSKARRGERYILAGVNRSYGDVMAELQQLTGVQRSLALPRMLAEWGALWSELGASLWEHPLEKFNLSVVRWGSLFNFCAVEKARRELGYQNRDFTQTLRDTVSDLLRRQVLGPSTPELRALLPSASQAAPTKHKLKAKRSVKRAKAAPRARAR